MGGADWKAGSGARRHRYTARSLEPSATQFTATSGRRQTGGVRGPPPPSNGGKGPLTPNGSAREGEGGLEGQMGREGQGGQVSWTHAPVTRRRASWAGVIGFWQRAQGSMAQRAVLASEPSGGRRAGGRRPGPGRSGRNRSPGDRPRRGRNDPGGPVLPARRSAPGVCAQPPLHGSGCSGGLGEAQQPVGVGAALIWVRRA